MLVTSLESFARYHGVSDGTDVPMPSVRSSGAAWERQALIRARLRRRSCAARASDPRRRARRLRSRRPAAGRDAPAAVAAGNELARERPGRYDLKTGRGGLLDIEFSTQWLQMQHGRDTRVRTPDTSQALEALVTAGHLGRPEYETLRETYAFLPRLEQRIHVLHATSATVIDSRAPGLAPLARRMGMHDSAKRTAVDEIVDRYRDVTESVRSAYERVLGV